MGLMPLQYMKLSKDPAYHQQKREKQEEYRKKEELEMEKRRQVLIEKEEKARIFANDMSNNGYYRYSKKLDIYEDKRNYIKKIDLVKWFFPNESLQQLQKRLRRAKKLDRYSKNEYITLVKNNFVKAVPKSSDKLSIHDYQDYYDDYENICYSFEVIVLNLDKIPDNKKVKDILHNFYWIHKDAFEPIKEIFL